MTLGRRRFLQSALALPLLAAQRPPPGVDWNKWFHDWFGRDFGMTSYYADDNAKLLASHEPVDVVFLGDSITEGWHDKRPGFFTRGRIDRGIGGQTTPQMLVRFRQDVIELQPRAVVILAGTNDIAGNTGPMRDEDIEYDLASMADLAKAHGIAVICASILPVHNYTPKSQDFFVQRPGPRILAVNRWLKEYCRNNGIVYLDYFSAMVDEKGLLKRDLAEDGLHPNDAGFKMMVPLAEAAIQKATGGQ